MSGKWRTPRGLSVAERFALLAIPEPNSGCWLWSGGLNAHGYARMCVSGRYRFASHIALELAGRPVPRGMRVCHHCDFPPCVNPDHLFIGTQADNVLDALRKGRLSKPPVCKPKEFCLNGHRLVDPNLYYDGAGSRHCVICARARSVQRRARFIAEGLRFDGRPRQTGRRRAATTAPDNDAERGRTP